MCTPTHSAMSKSAKDFLSDLTSDQYSKVTFDFKSYERENWHYIPKLRNGLSRLEMNQNQLRSADDLIANSVNTNVYHQIKNIINLELILKEIEQKNGSLTFDRNPNLYYYSMFGYPDNKEPWGWRIEGHHVSLNFTIVDCYTILATPSFLGSNPARIKHGKQKESQILKDEEYFARKLFMSLDKNQQYKAVIYPVVPQEFITRASRRVEITEPVGLAANSMNATQRRLLISLIKVYINRQSLEFAKKTFKKIEGDGIDNIHFAWVGSEHAGQPHYYRIHGPCFFAEYDNTQDNANHIHSVWRDLNNDFGVDSLQTHYKNHHNPHVD